MNERTIEYRARCGMCGHESPVSTARDEVVGEVSRCRKCGAEGRYTVESRGAWRRVEWAWARGVAS